MSKIYRAAAIGSTGKGNFGHGLDTCFLKNDRIELAAVADEDPAGLEKAVKATGAKRGYADYREMLTKEKLDLVSIGPRWVDRRVAMFSAAAQAGCHLYCEKPLAGNLADSDAMFTASRKAGVKVAVAHQFRAMAPVRQATADLKAGKFGRLVRMHARPKDDHRGGGEELIVHGTHLMDLMIMFGGMPRWVTGHVAVGDRDATRSDAHAASEPLGPIAGDSVAATFGFDHGVRATFDTTKDLYRADRTPYGLVVECEEATLAIRSPGDVFIYPAGTPVPENPKLAWNKLWVQDWHFNPDHTPRVSKDWLDRGNRIIVADLIAAIEENRDPIASGRDAQLALEMIQGVYASHLQGGRRLAIPLETREHPLGSV